MKKKQIELHVRGGGLVVALDLEQDPAIYMMNPEPEVIFWGERVFIRPPQEIIEVDEEGVAHVRYEEALASWSFTKLPRQKA